MDFCGGLKCWEMWWRGVDDVGAPLAGALLVGFRAFIKRAGASPVPTKNEK